MTTSPRSEYAKIGPNVYGRVPTAAAATLARAAREEPQFLKPSEIATKLRVCKMTVYRLVEEGAFPGTIRVGKSIRVPYSAFEAYVKASEVSQ